MLVASGSYAGNGTGGRSITGVGFQPDLVIVKGGANRAVCKTANMGATSAKNMTGSAGSYNTTTITAIGSDGFTVTSDALVNASGTTYYWLAIQDDGAGDFHLVSYTGNNVDHRGITGATFQPTMVWIFNSGAFEAVWRSAGLAGDSAQLFNNSVNIGRIESLDADGFTVRQSTTVNNSGTLYFAACFKTSSKFKSVTYTGNGSDNRSITGAGFDPSWAMVQAKTTVVPAILRFKDESGDNSFAIDNTAGEAANQIQAFITDGIQLGTSNNVNQNTVGYTAVFFLAVPPATILTPDPVDLALSIPAPSLSFGTKTLTPDPVDLTLSAPAPSLAFGSKILTPDPVTLDLSVPAATLDIFTGLVPVIGLKVDWDGDGDFDEDDEDVSAYLQSWASDRGRDFPGPLRGRCVIGKLSATLKNTDGRFSSFNAAGPLYGQILPGRLVQLNVAGPISDEIFTGYLDTLTPRSSIQRDHTAELVAYGPLGKLPSDGITTAVQSNVPTGTAVNAILDAAEWPSALRQIAGGRQSLSTWWANNQDPLAALREIESLEIGFLYETKDGKIAFEDRYYRYGLASGASYSDVDSAVLSYRTPTQGDERREIANQLTLEIEPYEAGATAVLWTLAEVASIPAGATRTYTATYPPKGQSTETGAAVGPWTTPVPTTDYTANSAADGSGTDLTGSVVLAVAKRATEMDIAITNNAGATAYLTLLQARGAPLQALSRIGLPLEDATSKTLYGRRVYQSAGRGIPTTAQGLVITTLLLAHYKDPHPALLVAIPGGRSVTQLADALGRDLSDRVTLVAGASKTSLGVSEDFIVESIHLEQRQDRVLWATFGLSPASRYANLDEVLGDIGGGGGGGGGAGADLFTLDVSELDGPDVLGI